jgi:hypothetical protein
MIGAAGAIGAAAPAGYTDRNCITVLADGAAAADWIFVAAMGVLGAIGL